MGNFVIEQSSQSDVIAFPCSATQKQFWLINQLAPENSAYNIPLGFIAGPELDVDALVSTVRALVDRHEVLRMTFHWEDGELEQHLLEDYRFELPVEEVSSEAAIEDYVYNACRTRFDLAAQPGFVARLARIPDGRYFVFFCFHHIIVDHAAVLIFEEELRHGYQAFAAGREPEFEPLEVQFGDFVLWRNENYTARDLQPVYEFWLKHLRGHKGKLAFPLDARRNESHQHTGQEVSFSFSPESSQTIRDFARQKGMSPYVAGLTALKVLLHRYSGQQDIVIGSPFTERGLLDELEGVMGCFMNMLPLASMVNPELSYHQLLDQQGQDFLDALDNLTVSLDEIVNRLDLERESGMNPLFQVGYTFQEAPAELSIPGLEIETLPLHSGGAMYDLHVWLWDEGNRIAGSVWYADELLREATVSQFLDDFESLYTALVRQPDVPVQALLGLVSFPGPVSESSGDALNSSQQLFWFSETFAHLGAHQNIASAWWSQGDFSPEVFEQRAGEISDHYPHLQRVLFTNSGSDVPHWQPTTDSFDTRVVTASSREEALAQVRALQETPFNLTGDLLLRFLLVRVPGEGTLVSGVAHNLLLDEPSLQQVVQWVLGAEPETVSGLAPDLRAHPYHLDRFWKEQMARDWGVLELTAQHSRPAEFDHRGDRLFWSLPSASHEGLQGLAATLKVEYEVLWVALIEMILYRHTHQNTLGFGVELNNEDTDYVGCQTDIMPLSAGIDGGRTVADHISRARQALQQLLAHRGLSYQEILAHYKGEKDPSRTPLVQCYMSIRQLAQSCAGDAGLYEKCHPGSTGARTDLSFIVEFDRNLTHVELEYAASVYDRDFIGALLSHFQLFVSSILADAGQTIDSVPILRTEEVQSLDANTQGPERPLPADDLVSLFATTVETFPDRVALTDQQESLTYSQLWQRAGDIAATLLKAGLQGDVVAIYMDRSNDMVASMLGILRAGATYLPLDPENPIDRIRIVLEDSGAKVCLTDSNRREGIESLAMGVSAILMSDIPGGQPLDALDGQIIAPDQLAYVIFTSGSTGRPKGVMVHHRAVVNFLNAMASTPGLEESDRLLATTTISFDISVLEIMLPLMQGAQVVLASRSQAMNGMELQRLIREYDISFLQATPTSWRVLMASGWEGGPGVKALVGGEALTEDLKQQLLPRVKELWNVYGPTETTVWSTVKKVSADTDSRCIGQPIDNTSVHVLNAAREPQPVNVPGELCIGGLGVTRGYWGRPDLTEERFVTLASGERVYRTGDRVHRDSKGDLYYHNRMDDQVKIRGYRIELGEIEARIREQDGVDNAAVIVKGDHPADLKLVAFVQPRKASTFSAPQMREALTDVLPAYMVPQHLVTIERMPQTASGKADKKMLASLPVDEAAGNDRLLLKEDIAAEFRALEGIREAVVILDGDLGELICYYETEEDHYVTLPELRKHARKILPKGNEPLRQFNEVDTWSRDDQGDINWRVLYEVDESEHLPQTEMETILHGLWTEVIGSDRIKRTDNFFDVGGHSLLAVQVITRLRNEHGIEISQDRLLFNTLDALAAECETLLADARQSVSQANAAGASAEGLAESGSRGRDTRSEKGKKGILSRFFRRGS